MRAGRGLVPTAPTAAPHAVPQCCSVVPRGWATQKWVEDGNTEGLGVFCSAHVFRMCRGCSGRRNKCHRLVRDKSFKNCWRQQHQVGPYHFSELDQNYNYSKRTNWWFLFFFSSKREFFLWVFLSWRKWEGDGIQQPQTVVTLKLLTARWSLLSSSFKLNAGDRIDPILDLDIWKLFYYNQQTISNRSVTITLYEVPRKLH